MTARTRLLLTSRICPSFLVIVLQFSVGCGSQNIATRHVRSEVNVVHLDSHWPNSYSNWASFMFQHLDSHPFGQQEATSVNCIVFAGLDDTLGRPLTMRPVMLLGESLTIREIPHVDESEVILKSNKAIVGVCATAKQHRSADARGRFWIAAFCAPNYTVMGFHVFDETIWEGFPDINGTTFSYAVSEILERPGQRTTDLRKE